MTDVNQVVNSRGWTQIDLIYERSRGALTPLAPIHPMATWDGGRTGRIPVMICLTGEG